MTAVPTLLHVFPTFAMGGSQRRTLDLANALGPAFRHVILAINGDTSAAALLDPALDVTLRTGLVRPCSGVSVGNLRRLRALLRETRADLLLTYNFGTLEAALANRVAPLAAHLHFEDGFGPEEADGRQIPRRVWARRVALSGGSRVAVPSRRLERIALEQWRLDPKRVLFIPNGIDMARWATPGGPPPGWKREGELVVGSVGVLRPEKNFGRLVRVFAKLPRDLPARLVLVGDGAERARLEALAAELGVAERVTFAGHMADPRPALHAFDIFALGSDTEQMPYSLVEAMAAGLPAICTDVGDVATMLPEANRALGVVPVATEDRFAAQLATLLGDAALRREAGARNRAHARAQYGLDVMVARYDRLFRDLIAAHRGEAPLPDAGGAALRRAA
jgi:glycosyltransferase involved in cell wall biosynthesis